MSNQREPEQEVTIKITPTKENEQKETREVL
jgi:hypothetical protein